MFRAIKYMYYDWVIDTFLMKSQPFNNLNNFFMYSGNLNQESGTEMVEKNSQYLMTEGLSQLKRALVSKIKEPTEENFLRELERYKSGSDDWKVAAKIPDLIQLSNDEDVAAWKKAFFNSFISKRSKKEEFDKLVADRVFYINEGKIRKQILGINQQLRKAYTVKDLELIKTLEDQKNDLSKRINRKKPY